MDIYFLRHASAGSQKLPGKEDELRAIDGEGEEQSRDVGTFLARLGLRPDAFLSSPLTRALQTAELVAGELGFKDEIVQHAALRPEARYEQFRELLQDYQRSKAIVVTGHNPRLSEFLSLLISRGELRDIIDLKKAAVAKVELEEHAALQWCVTPKLVRAAQGG